MSTKFVFTLSVFLALFLLSFDRVQACSCGRSPVCDGLANLSNLKNEGAVFLGTVSSIEKVKKQMEADGEKYSFEMLNVKFEVEEIFGGSISNQVTVVTIANSPSCGYPFSLGGKYLVYSYRDSKTNELTTGLCSRTKPFETARKEIEMIKRFKGEKLIKPIIFGRVQLYSYASGKLEIKNKDFVPKVQAQNKQNKQTFEVSVDSKGLYELENLPFGEYEMSVLINNFRKQFKLKPTLNIHAQCWQIDLGVDTNEVQTQK